MPARQSRISSHFLAAEMFAFPFSSAAALRSGIALLDPCLKEASTQKLWKAAEREILGAIPSITLDEFISYRDSIWFGRAEDSTFDSKPRPQRLLDMLQSFSRRLLTVDGDVAKPTLAIGDFLGHSGQGFQHARELWKWVVIALPFDLVVAGLGKGVARVDCLAPSLAGTLWDHGFAEVHLHVGAGLEFADYWSSTCEAVLEADGRPNIFKAPGGVGDDDGESLGSWIARACVTRYILTNFLLTSNCPKTESFSEYFLGNFQSELKDALGLTRALTIFDAVGDIQLGKLKDGEEAHRFYAIQAAFARLRESDWGAGKSRFRRKESSLPKDPLAELFHVDVVHGGALMVEHELLRRAFNYMSAAPEDDLFAELFWQATRVRCMFYRHVVQRPMTPGLPWFIQTFNRLGAGKTPLTRIQRTELAANTSGAGKGLCSLEYRTSPDQEAGSMLTDLHDLRGLFCGDESHLGLRNKGLNEVGVVLHFVRDRGGGMFTGNPSAHGFHSEADPSADRWANGARFGRYYREQRGRAYAMAAVLRDFPETLELLRGVDICADEAGVPIWVLKPLVQYVQNTAQGAAARLRRFEPGPSIRFHTTAHAGEDWLHLLGGMRRIHEAVEHFGMTSGDRLGHALALGVDAERWAREAGPIAMTLEERFLDLVWAWQRLTGLGEPGSAKVEDEIRRLFGSLFGTDQEPIVHGDGNPWVAVQLIERLHDVDALRRIRYPNTTFAQRAKQERAAHGPSVTNLFARYLFDVDVFRRGRKIIYVDPARDEALTTRLQAWLHREIGALGVVVEINPSSNFLTNQLSSFREHPAWRLRSPRGSSGMPRLAVVIGSDDPLTFATTLPAEYQLMHDALVLEGLTTEEADQWIEDARRNGLTHRWTRPSRAHMERFRRRREQQRGGTVFFDYAPGDHDVPLPP